MDGQAGQEGRSVREGEGCWGLIEEVVFGFAIWEQDIASVQKNQKERKYMNLKNLTTKVLLPLLFLSLCFGSTGTGIAHASSEMKSYGEISEYPQRIIVLPMFAEEILLEMIGPDRIVGVWHEYWEGGEVYTPTMELTKEMEHGIEIDDVGRIISLNPDLVITWDSNCYPYETIIPMMEEAGIVVLRVDTPVSFAQVKQCITLLGDVVGAQKLAAEMAIDMDSQLAELAQIVSDIPENERIRATDYHEYHPFDVYNNELANAAGVISDKGTVFIGNTYSQKIDDQLLLEWNPDLITIRPYTTDTDGTLYEFGEDYAGRFTMSMLKDPDLANISAIQNSNVHTLCIYESQYMVQSAMDLARLAYPHLFVP